MEQEFISLAELAKRTGYKMGSLYNKTANGTLPTYKPFGKVFVDWNEVKDLFLSSRSKTNSELKQ